MLIEKDIVLDTGWDAHIDEQSVAYKSGSLKTAAPFYAKVLQEVTTSPGCWNHVKVGIFQKKETQPSAGDIQVGEYIRNYPRLFRTFHPFRLYGKWYALYSPKYTVTRILSLPECKDIGGEENQSWGFCPTDFYVPVLIDREFVHDPDCPRDDKEGKTPNYTYFCTCERHDNEHYRYLAPERVHGFVAGCIWGDDCTWKIQYLDLTHAHEGIIKRDERFGYIEMPLGLDLYSAVDLKCDRGAPRVRISVFKYYDLETGKVIGPDDY